jgi:predicted helicase
MHSQIYREKYVEFLKTNFPSIPMTANKKIFYKFAKIGQQLIDLHLLNNMPNDNEIKVRGDFNKPFQIAKINPPSMVEPTTLRILTTDKKEIFFENISTEIYEFEIGSYRPIEK